MRNVKIVTVVGKGTYTVGFAKLGLPELLINGDGISIRAITELVDLYGDSAEADTCLGRAMFSTRCANNGWVVYSVDIPSSLEIFQRDFSGAAALYPIEALEQKVPKVEFNQIMYRGKCGYYPISLGYDHVKTPQQAWFLKH